MLVYLMFKLSLTKLIIRVHYKRGNDTCYCDVIDSRVDLVEFCIHLTGYFGDKSLQAVNCTGTDNQKQRNKIELKYREKTNTKKLALVKSSVKLPNPDLAAF